MNTVRIICGDARTALAGLPERSVHTVVTSPPFYGLRDYGCAGQIGLEDTPQEYIATLTAVFAAVHRVLHPTGTCWLNLGESYAAKQQLLLPHRVALALQDWGWLVRSTIVWSKPTAMPQGATDRPTQSHDYLFLLAKGERYYYDGDAIREPCPQRTPRSRKKDPKTGPLRGGHGTRGHDGNGLRYEQVYNNEAGRNKRSVWTIASEGYPEAHFATFPQKLVEPAVLAGTSEAGCCGRCGTPWRRITERSFLAQQDVSPRRGVRGVGGQKAMDASNTWQGWPRGVTAIRTTGWEPGCSCGPSAPVPCTVLDPFCGSGTVGLVAKRLGRNATLIDLSPAYCEMAQRRCNSIPYPLFSAAGTGE